MFFYITRQMSTVTITANVYVLNVMKNYPSEQDKNQRARILIAFYVDLSSFFLMKQKKSTATARLLRAAAAFGS